MEPCQTYIDESQASGFMTIKPIKASSNVNKWLVCRQSPDNSPNIFLTSDFKNYKRLTNLQPQKDWNWLTKELITCKQLDGSSSLGILYKPENFNPLHKYPIIFAYYEELSNKMYEFPQPAFSTNTINIPWFVSHGYLVFTPDIRYTIGKTGESAHNSIVSAAQYFSKLPWVDASKMGLAGHSFGGYETNYVVTHSNLFAAALSAAGPIELISDYGGLNGLGNSSTQSRYESGHLRIGRTLWERPDLLHHKLPLFNLAQVTTPILIMHNKADPLVPWSQSVEFFTGLRRLGKKAWMLQYDEGAHGLLLDKNAVDYTIRMTQFLITI